MRRFVVFLALIGALVLPSPLQPVGAGAVRAQTEFVDDEILVKFVPGMAASEIAAAHQTAGGTVVRSVAALDVQVVKVAPGQAVARLPLYQRNSNVLYAELNTIYNVADDPFYAAQWSLHNTGQLGGTPDADIDAPAAWATATGSGAKVAVVDTGIRKTHVELIGKVLSEANFSSDSTPDDLHGHGTHVGSTAAGLSGNGLGIHGVAPNAMLLNAKVLNSGGSGTCDGVANGITWAADNAASVINLSLGGGGCITMENAVNYAWGKNAVLACAAGNGGVSSPSYPAAYANCISVAATDRNDNKASFSNFGSTVDLGGPGVGIAAAILPSSAEVTTSSFGLLIVDLAGSQVERTAIPMAYSEITTEAGLEAEAVAIGGLGAASDFAAVNCAGKIAVIQRGTLTFAEKVQNAKNAGCVGAVIYNNVSGDINGTLGAAGNWLPVVGISQADGADLVSRINTGATLLRLAVRTDFGRWDGTSMATPQVSGAAALVWSKCGLATDNDNVRSLLESTADQISGLATFWSSGRRLNAANAVAGSCGTPPPPDFSIGCSPFSLSAAAGGSAASTCTISSLYGFDGAVSLACIDLAAANGACSFNPAAVTPLANGSVTSTLTVTVPAGAATGSDPFSVQAASGATTRTAALTLNVTPPAPPACPAPSGLGGTDSNPTGGGNINLSWDSVAGALTYRLQRRNVGSSNWTNLGTVSGTSWTGSEGREREYRVRVETSSGGVCVAPGAYTDPAFNPW